MTLGNLVQYVRYRAIDEDGIEYSVPEIAQYAKVAQDWILAELMRLGSQVGQLQAVLTLEDGSADLPPDFQRESAVLDKDGYPLTAVPYQVMLRNRASPRV